MDTELVKKVVSDIEMVRDRNEKLFNTMVKTGFIHYFKKITITDEEQKAVVDHFAEKSEEKEDGDVVPVVAASGDPVGDEP